MKKKLLIILIIFPFSIFSQKTKTEKDILIINVETLNIRDKPNKNSEIIGKAIKGEKYYLQNTLGDWLEINYSPSYDHFFKGYIHKNYVKFVNKGDIKLNSNNKTENQDLNFKQGFKKYGIGIFIGVYLILSGIDILSNRVKDARFKDGYRYKQNTQKVLKLLLYTVLISLPLALIAGVITHFA